MKKDPRAPLQPEMPLVVHCIEVVAIIVCFMLAVMFLGWALNRFDADSHPDTTIPVPYQNQSLN